MLSGIGTEFNFKNYPSEGTNPGFGLEGLESFRLFQKGFASSSPKFFGLES